MNGIRYPRYDVRRNAISICPAPPDLEVVSAAFFDSGEIRVFRERVLAFAVLSERSYRKASEFAPWERDDEEESTCIRPLICIEGALETAPDELPSSNVYYAGIGADDKEAEDGARQMMARAKASKETMGPA